MVRDLPTAGNGGPGNNATDYGFVSQAMDMNSDAAGAGRLAKKFFTRMVQGALAASLLLAMGIAPLAKAAADDLDDKKRQLASQIKSSNSNLSQYRKDLSSAQARLNSSVVSLDNAKANLDKAQTVRAQAQNKVVTAKLELAQANQALAKAKVEVYTNQVALARQQKLIGQNARLTMQNQSPLVGVGILVNADSSVGLSQRLQWTDQVFNSTSNQIDSLAELEIKLQAAEEKASKAEADLKAKKDAADQSLVDAKDAEALATQAEADMAQLVKTNTAAKNQASAAVKEEEQRLAKLKQESDSIEARIAERIRKQREAEEAARKAAAAKKAASSKSSSSSSSSYNKVSSSGLMMPVNAYISSPYGMRLHPILGYYKLHDGTDLAASCGTPIKAAADGVVSERYFSAGYGNRLMIDHGKVNGTYLTTGYNHASSYVVGVGQHVRKGQTVGYVGTTGWSTGCHLHLMVWANGKVTNPMNWF